MLPDGMTFHYSWCTIESSENYRMAKKLQAFERLETNCQHAKVTEVSAKSTEWMGRRTENFWLIIVVWKMQMRQQSD